MTVFAAAGCSARQLRKARSLLDPLSTKIAAKVTTVTYAETLKRLKAHFSANDDQHALDRVELALDWGVELKQAFAVLIPLLQRKFADLDERLAALFDDTQTGRIYGNIGFEAIREAIDERRKMLAHAAVGILDPDLPIERKARVERRLRELEPIDVRTLFGMATLLRSSRAKDPQALLFASGSGDVLVASGCVRLQTSGGGGFGGVGVSNTVFVTELGRDVLIALRSYLVTRGASFVVPGREFGAGDRTENEARAAIAQITALTELLARCRKETEPYSTLYYQREAYHPASAGLRFFVRVGDPTAAALVAKLAQQSAAFGVQVVQEVQAYSTYEHEDIEILRTEVSGPHDLLRHSADDFEAAWI